MIILSETKIYNNFDHTGNTHTDTNCIATVNIYAKIVYYDSSNEYTSTRAENQEIKEKWKIIVYVWLIIFIIIYIVVTICFNLLLLKYFIEERSPPE